MLAGFFDTVLPHSGAYCLFFTGTRRHQWVGDLEALAQAVNSCDPDARDIYFCTASFATTGSREGGNAVARRSVCLDIDAGAEKYAKHGDKVYPHLDDAMLALAAWIRATGMIPTYIVTSGAGLHVYYSVDRDLSIEQWQPLADATKAMALSGALRIDGQVTSDIVRVLRPPGTLHPNGNTVKIIGDRRGALYTPEQLAALVAAFVPSALPPARRERRMNADVLDAPVGPPKSVEKVRERCAAMAHAMQLRGDVPEPYWRAMLGVIKFTVEGEDAAHAYSRGHPEYDPDQTQNKFHRWTAGPTTCATFAVENPAACRACPYNGKVKSPVQLGELTPVEVTRVAPGEAPAASPTPAPARDGEEFTLGDADLETAAPAPPQPWDGYLPDGYRIVRAGAGYVMVTKVEVKRTNAAGDTVADLIDLPFCSAPFWFESWAPGVSDSDHALAVYCVYDTARSRVTRYTMPTKAMAVRNEFMSVLASQNVQVYPSTKQAKDSMENYVKASLERIRAVGQRAKIADRFGSIFNDKGHLLVAQGTHLITPGGDIYEGVVQDLLRSRGAAYCVPLPHNPTGHWGPEVWDEHILPRARRHVEYLQEFYSDPNFRPYQLAIMLAWASPMLAFVEGTFHPGSPLPGLGLTVSLFSTRSGIGKTSAMRAAAMAFGVPNAVVLQLDRNNSTDNARHMLVLQSGTMPCFMDEMEDVNPRDLASLISSVGNGVSKTRLRKDLSTVGGHPTALINLMSTNKSHRELVAVDRSESPATQLRLLEIDCSEVQEVSREVALAETEARSRLHDCAGAVGALIHYRMCREGPAKLNAFGVACADKARQLLDGRQDGRFMWRALGAVIAVRTILASYGIKLFSQGDIVREFRRWHDAGYQYSADNLMPTEPGDLLSMFLSDIAGKTLITHEETQRNPKQELRVDVPLNDRMPDNVLARSVLSRHYVHVKTDALRQWCQERRIGYQGLVGRARDAGLFVVHGDKLNRQIDLYKGTKLSQNVRSFVFTIDLTRLTRNVDYTAHITDNVVPLARPDTSGSQTPSESASA